MSRTQRASATLVLLVWSLVAAPLASRADPAPGDRVWVRMTTAGAGAGAPAGDVLAQMVPIQALDYGGFWWLQLDRVDLDRLQASGADYQVYPDPYTLELGGQRFDPAREAPQLPAGWAAPAC